MTSAPLLLGHRGSPRAYTENTLEGFQAALDAGLDGVELDVRRLADGTLVIHHDAELTDGRSLPGLRREELPAHVPSLTDALAWMADTGAYVNIELKHESVRPDDRVHRTLDAVRGLGLGARVIVSSFMPTYLHAARRAAPEIERGFLFHKPYAAPLLRATLAWTGSAALHPHHSLIDDNLMALARSGGWRVNTWTVNEPDDVRRLTALGVDALIGDLPDVLLTAREP